MRRLNLLLVTALCFPGCYAAPGAPRTDVGVATTEHTGHYEVVGRQAENGRYRVEVQAAYPERAELIASSIVDQMRSFSPREVVVAVGPLEGHEGETRMITWTRPTGTLVPRAPETTHGTSPADRQSSPAAERGATP